jgi:hypothetical protein
VSNQYFFGVKNEYKSLLSMMVTMNKNIYIIKNVIYKEENIFIRISGESDENLVSFTKAESFNRFFVYYPKNYTFISGILLYYCPDIGK